MILLEVYPLPEKLPTNLKPSICLIQNHWKKSIEKSDWNTPWKKSAFFFIGSAEAMRSSPVVRELVYSAFDDAVGAVGG